MINIVNGKTSNNVARYEVNLLTTPKLSNHKGTRLHKELPDAWKERIRAGVIMDKLIKCVNGTLEMDSNRIRAAEILLRKIVPDLQRSEVTGKDGKDLFPQLNDEQMIERIKNLMDMAYRANQPIMLESTPVKDDV
jgi:hypothetical protein